LKYIDIFCKPKLAQSLLNESRVRLREAARAKRYVGSSVKRVVSEHAAKIYAAGG
jgi:hypothetical protein